METALVVLAILAGIASIYGAVVHLTQSWSPYLTWREVETMMDSLATKLAVHGIHPSLICGTGRGGGILAAMLSCRMQAAPVLVFDREYVKSNGTLRAKPMLNSISVAKDFQSKRDGVVVLITPRSDPGITLEAYGRVLFRSGFEHIVKCCLQKSSKSRDIDLSFYIEEYSPGKRCKNFPWTRGTLDIMESGVARETAVVGHSKGDLPPLASDS